jgi:hypothetical protein
MFAVSLCFDILILLGRADRSTGHFDVVNFSTIQFRKTPLKITETKEDIFENSIFFQNFEFFSKQGDRKD